MQAITPNENRAESKNRMRRSKQKLVSLPMQLQRSQTGSGSCSVRNESVLMLNRAEPMIRVVLACIDIYGTRRRVMLRPVVKTQAAFVNKHLQWKPGDNRDRVFNRDVLDREWLNLQVLL